MSHNHFTIVQRAKIEAFIKIGYSSREIALKLGCHRSSVSREVKRFDNPIEYEAEEAQRDYEEKRQNSKPNGKLCEAVENTIADKIKATWSPEQISNTVLKGKVSFKTIYNWIYSGRIADIDNKNLRRKGKRKASQTAKFFARGTSIRKRPKAVYKRKTFGHWELDTVVACRSKSHKCFATFIERKTRLYTAVLMPDRTSKSMENAIKQVYGSLPEKAFLTATTDRGGEFACFQNIKQDLELTLYFADPYCPHQRGSNEYGNGLLREFFPKNSCFDNVSKGHLGDCLDLINNRPRKCLGWISPIQAFDLELAHLT